MMSTGSLQDITQDKIDSQQQSKTGIIEEVLWTVEDLAFYLQLQPETVRSLARRGELPAIKLGKVWRFQRMAIDEILLARK
jgi:excisionase family DNA binding protein